MITIDLRLARQEYPAYATNQQVNDSGSYAQRVILVVTYWFEQNI